jgi:rhamnose utilization protein RhaD (predicted bifunctional aldolase and dehydrogenase)/NAD(P)-dependent dehydrogenase (short-subunit alcohol dehydrogenase family)
LNMQKNIRELIDISRYYGSDKRYVIAGGGNTSMKTNDRIWIKASGFALADIREEGFALLDRTKLQKISSTDYSQDPFERESQIKSDLMDACIIPGPRPSVETSLHDLIPGKFVVHIHATLVNGLMCSMDAGERVQKLFGSKVLYMAYSDPGYILFKEVEKQLKVFSKKNGKVPEAIFLQNHGIFVGADSPGEIRSIYDRIFSILEKEVSGEIPSGDVEPAGAITEVLPALRMILSEENLKTLRLRNNELVQHFTGSDKMFGKISRPFSPDIIVYCKSNYIYCDKIDTAEDILQDLEQQIKQFRGKHGYLPRVLLIKGLGLVAAGDDAAGADIILDIFEDLMKISWLSENFGGPHFMSDEQVKFIDTWEVENYRRKTMAGQSSRGRAENRTIIITGGAMGFGAGIGRGLFLEGANIVIADINEQAGKEFWDELSGMKRKNQALFVKTDVSDPESLKHLMERAVEKFGGFDGFISNAGILRAGGLEDMDEEAFDLVTRINYNAYFYGTKYASLVMKLQQAYKNDHFTDIIQINSKSGLAGSKKNFAYAGSKFGGIGLTQSFALELAPHRIKVNSICPGNFFEGPLWSDPGNGLFVQYLNAGKVPGAKNIKDVQEYYENQVPLGRGCRTGDVVKAVLYIMDQEYETGQAVPVTGGQNMLR